MGFGFLVVGGFGLEASRFKGLRLKRLKLAECFRVQGLG